jgi:hypothetical protein
MQNEDHSVTLATQPIPELPQDASLDQITRRARELRSAELGGLWGLTEARLGLGQAVTLARVQLNGRKFAEWLDEVQIPTALWRTYTMFWQSRAQVRLQLSEKLSGQTLLPGISPTPPAGEPSNEPDSLAAVAEKGELCGVDFSDIATLFGELKLREKNVVAQCRENRRFVETLAAKVLAGGQPTEADASKMKEIRVSLAA